MQPPRFHARICSIICLHLLSAHPHRPCLRPPPASAGLSPRRSAGQLTKTTVDCLCDYKTIGCTEQSAAIHMPASTKPAKPSARAFPLTTGGPLEGEITAATSSHAVVNPANSVEVRCSLLLLLPSNSLAPLLQIAV